MSLRRLSSSAAHAGAGRLRSRPALPRCPRCHRNRVELIGTRRWRDRPNTVKVYLCRSCRRSFADPRARGPSRRKVRDNVPRCPQCHQPARPAGFHHRKWPDGRRVRRWFCRGCRRQFFTDRLPPLLPRRTYALAGSPEEHEARGLYRMMVASGLRPEHIRGLIEITPEQQIAMRAEAGLTPAMIDRAVEQRRKVAEAFRKLLAKQREVGAVLVLNVPQASTANGNTDGNSPH